MAGKKKHRAWATMVFFWTCSNANIATSPLKIILLLLGLSNYFAFSNAWILYGGLLTLGYLALGGLPMTVNYGLSCYDTFYMSGIMRNFSDNAVSWDFLFWANYLFSFQIYVMLIMCFGLYLFYAAFATYGRIVRIQNFVFGGSNASGNYFACLLDALYFGCSIRANTLLFVVPLCAVFACYTAVDAGMRDISGCATLAAYASAYRPYAQNTGTGICLISDNLLLQSYYVVPHTLFILLFYFFNLFHILLFRYFAFTSCTGFFQEVASRLSSYFLPVTITSLFFGGLWSMHNDFFFLFWSWDYIELFFLDFVLLLSVFGHIFSYAGTLSISLVILPVLLLKFFRLSLLESVHHLSLFNNSIFLAHNSWVGLFPSEASLHSTVSCAASSFLTMGVGWAFFLAALLALYNYNSGLRCTSGLTSLCTTSSFAQFGTSIRIFKIQIGYDSRCSQYVALSYCYYFGLLVVFALLVFGGGFLLTSLSAACSVFLIGEGLYYLMFVVWLVGFFFWVRYFSNSLILGWQYMRNVVVLYILYFVGFKLLTATLSRHFVLVDPASSFGMQNFWSIGLFAQGIFVPLYCLLPSWLFLVSAVVLYSRLGNYLRHFLYTQLRCKASVSYAAIFCRLYVSGPCLLVVTAWLRKVTLANCTIIILPRLKLINKNARLAIFHHMQFSLCFTFLIFCFFYQTFNFSQVCVANSAISYGSSFFFLSGAYSALLLNSLPQFYSNFIGVAPILPTASYWHVPNVWALPLFHNFKFFNLFFIRQGIPDFYTVATVALESLNINFLYGDMCVNRVYPTQALSFGTYDNFNIYGNFSLVGCYWGALWYYETFFVRNVVVRLFCGFDKCMLQRLRRYFCV